ATNVSGRRFIYASVPDGPRKVIHAVRVVDDVIELDEISEIIAKVQQRMLSRGEQLAEVVLVQGKGKTELRLVGDPYAVSRVRAAMFHAAINGHPFELR